MKKSKYFFTAAHTNIEVKQMTDNMNQKQQEKIQEKKNLEKFNSITQKVKPETRTRPTMYEKKR